jgi:hypothetical protein
MKTSRPGGLLFSGAPARAARRSSGASIKFAARAVRLSAGSRRALVPEQRPSGSIARRSTRVTAPSFCDESGKAILEPAHFCIRHRTDHPAEMPIANQSPKPGSCRMSRIGRNFEDPVAWGRAPMAISPGFIAKIPLAQV